ncbi:adipokinetic hormone/corazonin-related peptide receptor variant I, partial [Hyalella azteca]|uniref:Adipokinetic hormone/corazonin-related peptide receptor variant I n=1 Tax=Hyalella azteca TaxID=294128 RepID=A0A979FUZ1_HYAAZ
MLIFHVDSHEVHRHYRQCVTFGSFPSLRHEMVYNLFCLTMLYVAPITIIVMSYGAIVITIVRKTKLTADESVIRRSGIGYLGKAKARTIKMTGSIVAAFFICWTPYVIISLWFCFAPEAAKRLDQRVQKTLFVFACAISCANPLVYGIFNFCKQKPKVQLTLRSSTAHTHLAHSSATYSKGHKPGSLFGRAGDVPDFSNRASFRFCEAQTSSKNSNSRHQHPEARELCSLSSLSTARRGFVLARKPVEHATSLETSCSERPAATSLETLCSEHPAVRIPQYR